MIDCVLKKYINLKKKIKKNEGFKPSVYFDQLGFATIGYGHLIKEKEKIFINKAYSKKFLLKIFNSDFKLSVDQYEKHYGFLNLQNNTRDVLIEMIFQLGIKSQKKFKKMNAHIKKNQIYMACLEMKDSLWCAQTPVRVNKLIATLIKKNER